MSRRRQSRGGRIGPALVVAVVLGVGVGWWLALRSLPLPVMPVRTPVAKGTPRAARPLPSPRAQSTTAPKSASPQIRPAGLEPAIPQVAIVFDDAGGSLADVEAIVAIGRPMTVAVLPDLAYSAEVARRARDAGLEVILHLPLEAEDGGKALGPGGITVAMSDQQIKTMVRTDLASVPRAVGVNNHMGSRGSADPRVMRAVLEVVLDQGLFFLDSRTTKDTVVEPLAAELGVRVARRAVFLDNDEREEAIRSAIERLIALAHSRGSAIAIGHAQRDTSRVVAAMLGAFDRQRVMLVPLSALVQ